MCTRAECADAIELLQIHWEAYTEVKPFADKYKHPHPTDTRGWSQIIVSALTGINGLSRKKGPDLEDGSDVKAANCWDAIDTPRFNGCIKAGTQSATANKLTSLDTMPYLFFVMWDKVETGDNLRCRIWVVMPDKDKYFRQLASIWYAKREIGTIRSDNFQLHPPRNTDSNIFRNTCGNLEYPLLFEARLIGEKFSLHFYGENVLGSGACSPP